MWVFAARIFLLLAMDTAIMGEVPTRGDFNFAGQIWTVREFLDAVNGSSPKSA
ncbi:hypothetical protein PI125_g24581 [Phytophthora idaei]|nr:hypothetical protein PI125_g24581 [Phytophthora idaei]KAG3126042.1 hypothetical protein PI126_g22503 [Phytophthora idaei]